MREISVVEQRYRAVSAVVAAGRRVPEVAGEWKVSRQTLHSWLARYEADGLEGLADAETPKVSVDTSTRPTLSAPAAAVSRTTMLAFSALGNTDALATSRRMSRPDIGLAMTPTVASATSRWRLTRQPLACCSPIALPCPPPSRVPSAGYA